VKKLERTPENQENNKSNPADVIFVSSLVILEISEERWV
jgi:hypothetical protein